MRDSFRFASNKNLPVDAQSDVVNGRGINLCDISSSSGVLHLTSNQNIQRQFVNANTMTLFYHVLVRAKSLPTAFLPFCYSHTHYSPKFMNKSDFQNENYVLHTHTHTTLFDSATILIGFNNNKHWAISWFIIIIHSFCVCRSGCTFHCPWVKSAICICT